MLKRKLASIQYVHDITPIEGADRIELAHVLGWQCVVKKGEFKVGDVGIYFEIDSFLPMDERFSFLKNSYKKSDFMGEGYRIRTQKMRGELSQGLLMPLTAFPEITDPQIGDDVTELLGVRKWEIEERVTTGGTVIGELPHDVPHSDEARVQVWGKQLIPEFEAAGQYYITSKMDGSSHSLFIDPDGHLHVCGHNYEYKDGSFWDFVHSRGLSEAMRAVWDEKYSGHSLVIQGEFCGAGIQQNRLKLKAPEWYIFTVIVDGKRLGLYEMQDVVEMLNHELTIWHNNFAFPDDIKNYTAKTVPVEEVGDHFAEKYPTIDAVLERADGFHPNGARKEGIVIRPVVPVKSETLDTWLSMKAVSNKYLLKMGD